MRFRTIAILSVLPSLLLGATASAQTDLTCADIQFSAEVTSRYPDAPKACVDVVEVDGERYAKMNVELVRTRANNATFRFVHPDGTYGPTHRAELDPDWRAEINGRTYRISQLQRGQELSIYLPSDRWEADVRTTMEVFVVYRRYALYVDDDTAMASLPSTASPLMTIGAMGGAFLLTAFFMRVRRRRSNR
jgi:hypothetical protein